MPRRLIPALLLALTVAACGSAAPTPPTSPAMTGASPSGDPSPTPVPTDPGATATPTAAPPSQSDSSWGRLWDALPPGFPVPPGATPTQVAEPVSAAFDLPISVSEAATFMQAALEEARFSTLAMSGPFEDGRIVIDSVGPTNECLVETSIGPAGGLTRLTIRYGAACPID